MELYERIKKRRKELKMSQDELAKLVGYKSRSSVHKIEAGLNDIPQSKIKLFAQILKTTPIWLMEGDVAKAISMSIKGKRSKIDDGCTELIEYWNTINEEGKEDLLKHARLLADSPQYKKLDNYETTATKERKNA